MTAAAAGCRPAASERVSVERILVLGAHASSGPSMQRYTRLLGRALAEVTASAVVAVPSDRISRRFKSPGLRKWLSYLEKFVLFVPRARRLARTYGSVHIADHSDAIWVLVLPGACHVAVTCHDLDAVRAAMGEVPEFRPAPFGRMYQRLVRAGLRRADTVVAVSAATARDVQRIVGRCSPVLPNPLDPDLTIQDTRFLAERRFLLTVSSLAWQKRRTDAFRAWRALQRTGSFGDVDLVIVGPELTDEERCIAADATGRVFVVREPDDEQLARMYRAASAVLVLSSAEGFGWPVLEAQAHGTPVLASDIPALRETAGDGAVFVSRDVLALGSNEAWETLAMQLSDDTLRRRAMANAERFSWDRFVENVGTMIAGSEHRPPATWSGAS